MTFTSDQVEHTIRFSLCFYARWVFFFKFLSNVSALILKYQIGFACSVGESLHSSALCVGGWTSVWVCQHYSHKSGLLRNEAMVTREVYNYRATMREESLLGNCH